MRDTVVENAFLIVSSPQVSGRGLPYLRAALIGEKVRRERRWTSAGVTPARTLVRSTREETATSSRDLLKRGVVS